MNKKDLMFEAWNNTTNRLLKFAYGMIESSLDSNAPIEYRVNNIEMALSIINKVRSMQLKEKELFQVKGG